MCPKENCNFGHRNVQNFLFKNLYELYVVGLFLPIKIFLRFAPSLRIQQCFYLLIGLVQLVLA